jgi:hypothetical protein
MLIEGSGSGSIPLTSGSGSGSWRPKNMWVRIRNTGVVDRHRFDAYLDPDRHQNDADPHLDPTSSFKHVENQK